MPMMRQTRASFYLAFKVRCLLKYLSCSPHFPEVWVSVRLTRVLLRVFGVHASSQVAKVCLSIQQNYTRPEERTFAGMLSAVDEGIGNVTDALKARHVG